MPSEQVVTNFVDWISSEVGMKMGAICTAISKPNGEKLYDDWSQGLTKRSCGTQLPR